MKGDICTSCPPWKQRKGGVKVIRKADGRTICLTCDSRSRSRDRTAWVICAGCGGPKRKNTYEEGLGWLCGFCARKAHPEKCGDCDKEKYVEARVGGTPICKNCLQKRNKGICTAGCNSQVPRRLIYRVGGRRACQTCYQRKKRWKEER